jgi:hypothetical protein
VDFDDLAGRRKLLEELSGTTLRRQVESLTRHDFLRELEPQRQLLGSDGLDKHLATLRAQATVAGDLIADLKRDLADQVRLARQPWHDISKEITQLREVDDGFAHRMKSIVDSFQSQQKFIEAQGSVHLAAQQYLSSFDWQHCANSAQLSVLREPTAAIARAYEDLHRAIELANPRTLLPILYDLPPLEIAAHAGFLWTLIEPAEEQDEGESEAESELLIEELRERVSAQLEPKLGDLHAGLPTMWVGAREALRSSNPDRIRHAAISTRELITHVLHLLAPDADVREWTKTPEHFHEDKPTRRARILYICRHVTTGKSQYASFVDKILEGTLAKLNLLQKGAHEIEASFGDARAAALWLSLGGDVLLLIETAEGN